MNQNHIDDGIENTVNETAQNVTKAAGEVGRDARKRADDLKSDAAKQLSNAAEAMRREARDAKVDASALKMIDDVATQLEKASVFLQNNSFETMANTAAREIEQSTKENPWRNILIALIVGFFFGLMMRGGRK